MVRLGLSIAASALALFSSLTLAQDQIAPNPPAASGAGTENQTSLCIAAGAQYQVGQFACIPACHGRRRFVRCDMTGAAASWTYISEDCPSAMINPPWPSDWSELPVMADMTPIPLDVNKSAPVPEAKTLTFATFGT